MFGEKMVVTMFNKSKIFTENTIDEIDSHIWYELDKHYKKFVHFNLIETSSENKINIVTYTDGKVNIIGSIVGDMKLINDYNWTGYLEDKHQDIMIISEYNDNIDNDNIYNEVLEINSILNEFGGY